MEVICVPRARRLPNRHKVTVMSTMGFHKRLEYDTEDTGFTMNVKRGSLKYVRFMLLRGADPNDSVASSKLPLWHAMEAAHWDVAELLVQFGANTDRFDLLEDCGDYGDYATPLTMAMAAKQWSLAKLLLEKGADPNNPGKLGKTPLVLATDACQWELVNLARRNGARACVLSLYHAIRGGREGERVARQMIKYDYAGPAILSGAKLWGTDAVLEAIELGYLDVASELVKQGADYMTENKSGVTALQIARERGYKGLVALMEEWLI